MHRSRIASFCAWEVAFAAETAVSHGAKLEKFTPEGDNFQPSKHLRSGCNTSELIGLFSESASGSLLKTNR